MTRTARHVGSLIAPVNPLVVPFSPLVVLVFSLVVLVCQFVWSFVVLICPLGVLVCPLVVSVCSLVVPVVLSVGLSVILWVRLNYATTHHQPKYIHHHPPPAKIYPPLPTISQKMDHHPAKAKIYWYITSFRHCFNSFFFFEMQYSFPWRRFCVIKFWTVRFSNSRFLLHSVLFTIFKIF